MVNNNYTVNLKFHFRLETIQNSRVNDSFIQVYYIDTEDSIHYLSLKKLLEMCHHGERTSTQYTSLTTARKYYQAENLQPQGIPVFTVVPRTAVTGFCMHMTMYVCCEIERKKRKERTGLKM